MTYRVERADPDRDRDDILALWRRHLPHLRHPERNLGWGYVDNPFSSGRIWRLIADGRIVGVAGIVLRRLKVGDTVVLVGRLGGLAIEPEHRSLGPALMLQRAVIDERGHEGLAAVYTSSPGSLVQVTARAGYRELLTLTRHVRLLDARPALARRLGTRWPVRALASVATAALRMATVPVWRRFAVTEIEAFDERFDDLWVRAAPHYGVTTERTARFLAWRFRENPVDISFTTLGMIRPGERRLRGYATCSEESGVVSIVDILAEDTGASLQAMLACVSGWARARGAMSVTVKCAAAGTLGIALRRCGFFERADDHALTIMVSPLADSARNSLFTTPGQWHFLAADDFWH